MKSSSPTKIVNVMLSSVDGRIAKRKGESTPSRHREGFTSPDDFEHMRKLVAECDAVFVGWRSLAAERGAFRTADLRTNGQEPLWVVFSRTGEMDLSHSFWRQSEIPRAVAFCTGWETHPPMARSETRDLLGCPTEFFVGNIGGILSLLRGKEKLRIALLGGGELNAHFWNAKLIHKLHLTLSPTLTSLAGSVPFLQGLEHPVALNLTNLEQKNGFLFLEYTPKEES
jgi:riboflavin biosynthesis pyrimidine reductase